MANTKPTGYQKQALEAFSYRGFTQERRKLWWIWGAKETPCEYCHAPAHSPCLNVSDKVRISKGANIVQRTTKWPHEQRVDWYKIVMGLRQRGHIL